MSLPTEPAGPTAEPTEPAVSVLFVCTGNICRSPTAEGVFRDLVARSGLSERVHIDSAGTHGYHVGNPPDARAQGAAQRRGYDLAGQRARQMELQDCERFDYVLVMDEANRQIVEPQCPKAQKFLAYAETDEEDVPDPYYGGDGGFERVLDLVEAASEGLLGHIRRVDL